MIQKNVVKNVANIIIMLYNTEIMEIRNVFVVIHLNKQHNMVLKNVQRLAVDGVIIFTKIFVDLKPLMIKNIPIHVKKTATNGL